MEIWVVKSIRFGHENGVLKIRPVHFKTDIGELGFSSLCMHMPHEQSCQYASARSMSVSQEGRLHQNASKEHPVLKPQTSRIIRK
jgi:hypothetical protein